jgi:hypothetical protein
MTSYVYQLELAKRGFVFNASTNVWAGPFGLTTSGYLSNNDPFASPGRGVDDGYARVAALQQIDERLRDKRGLSRGALIKPKNEFTTDFTPQQPILPPGN